MLPTLVLSFLIGLVTGYFAHLRSRSPYFWFAIGMLFGMLGLLFLFFLPPIGEEKVEEEEPEILLEQWFYLDKQHNICELPGIVELRMFWAKGIINENSYFWKKGMADWKEAKHIPFFQSLFSIESASGLCTVGDAVSNEVE